MGSKQPATVPCGRIRTLLDPAAWAYGARLISGSVCGLGLLSLQDPWAQSSEREQNNWLTNTSWHNRQSMSLADLLALKVSPHRSLAADGQASAVQNGQHKGRKGNEDKSDNSQYDGRGFLPVSKDRIRGRNGTLQRVMHKFDLLINVNILSNS